MVNKYKKFISRVISKLTPALECSPWKRVQRNNSRCPTASPVRERAVNKLGVTEQRPGWWLHLFLLLTVFLSQNNMCCWSETKVTVADVICHLLCRYEGSLPCCFHPSTISCLFFTAHDGRRVSSQHLRKQCPWKEGSSRDGAHTVRTRKAVHGQLFSFVPPFWMQSASWVNWLQRKDVGKFMSPLSLSQCSA